MARGLRLLLALWAAPAAAIRSGSDAGGLGFAKATPVEKVITLLQQLSNQIAEEGKTEAAEYDRFACFCKAQASDKTYQIEKSDQRIAELTATIDSLGTAIADLSGEVASLGQRISDVTGQIGNETAKRAVEHGAYLIADANVTEAISAVKEAIETLRASRTQVGGGMRVAFTQLQEAAGHALSKLSTLAPATSSGAQLQTVSAMLQRAAQPGQPAAYKYQSGEIITLLQQLLVDFKNSKQRLFDDEFSRRTDSDKLVLGLANEKKFKEEAKLQKEALIDAKTQDKTRAEQEKLAEKLAKEADVDFRGELKTQCETRAQEWDQRSTARAQEITAISEGVEILRTAVNPNYGANKRLVSIERAAVVQHGAWHAPGAAGNAGEKLARASSAAVDDGHKAATSFLQESQDRGMAGGTSSAAAVQRVLRHLDDAASRLHSPALSTLAAKAALETDHFGKVRALINDLITRLEGQATAEATSKSFCDTEMGRVVTSRDTQKLAMEEQSAVIAKQSTTKAQLMREIADLSQEIAGLHKALNDATQLRTDEKAQNAKTQAEAAAGKTAVEQAISILQAFYGSSSLLQYVPPKSDREGLTVGDRAPAVSWSGDYVGKVDASKGIFGLLQVILDDFDRTITAVGTAEAQAAQDFINFQGVTQGSINSKKSDKTTKETDVVTADSAILAAQDSYASASRLHKVALDELQSLSTMCAEGEESWAERKASREREIEALKQALKILEEWKS